MGSCGKAHRMSNAKALLLSTTNSTLFSSMVERRFVEPDTVVRSYHQGPIHSGVAQLVAQVTLNHKAVGSSPASRANQWSRSKTVNVLD